MTSSMLSLYLFLWLTHTYLVLEGWFLWIMTDFLPLKFRFFIDATAKVVVKHLVFILYEFLFKLKDAFKDIL